MAGKTQTVKQGDYFAKIAKKYGFSDWRTIYNHADNAELKQKRPDPNILHPGVGGLRDRCRNVSAGSRVISPGGLVLCLRVDRP